MSALAFSPDGRTLASGGVDSTLKLWDVSAARKGEARRELVRQPAAVTALAFVAEGRLLVTGHTNRMLRVMDMATRRLTATLRGPEAVDQPAVRLARRAARWPWAATTARSASTTWTSQAQIAHLDAAQEAGRRRSASSPTATTWPAWRSRTWCTLWDLLSARAGRVAVGTERGQLRRHHAVRRGRPHRGRAGRRTHPRLGTRELAGARSTRGPGSVGPATPASSRRTRGPGSRATRRARERLRQQRRRRERAQQGEVAGAGLVHARSGSRRPRAAVAGTDPQVARRRARPHDARPRPPPTPARARRSSRGDHAARPRARVGARPRGRRAGMSYRSGSGSARRGRRRRWTTGRRRG